MTHVHPQHAAQCIFDRAHFCIQTFDVIHGSRSRAG
jgi:hypothetical protein